jgi:hypothetical protein
MQYPSLLRAGRLIVVAKEELDVAGNGHCLHHLRMILMHM